MGPYEVVTTFDNGSVKIKTIDGSEISFVVNGHRLRLYHQPTSKQDFIQNVLQQNEMELVEGEYIPPPPDLWKIFWVIITCIYVNMCLLLLINKSHS